MPSTPTGGVKQTVLAGSSYAATSLSADCPMTFSLRTVSPDAAYGGSALEVTAAGDVKVDVDALLNTNVYIQVTSTHGGYVNSNAFVV